MEEPISKLVSYTCPSCGGRLETDENRKLMVCRSCGNNYDYDYFCGENLIKAADKALVHKNYTLARHPQYFKIWRFHLKILIYGFSLKRKRKKIHQSTLGLPSHMAKVNFG